MKRMVMIDDSDGTSNNLHGLHAIQRNIHAINLPDAAE